MATHTRRSGYGVAFFRSGNPKRQRGMAEATILPRVLPLPSSRFAFYPTENVTNPITRWRSGIPEKDVKAGDLCQIGGGAWRGVAWRGDIESPLKCKVHATQNRKIETSTTDALK